MHFRNVCSLLLVSSSALALSGCDNAARAAAEQAASPQTQAKVAALVEKTKNQMKFVQGGSFWLGDFGVLMPSDGEGKFQDVPPPGPEIKDASNLPFTTISENNKPPRWVSLDSFSMQSHKVTYGDFDVYVLANALPAHPPVGKEIFHEIWRDARSSDAIPAGVSWYQAKAYCQWLGKVSGLPIDLPTEAQWEFAASNRVNRASQPMPTDNGILEEGRNMPTYEQMKKMIGPRGALYPVGKYPPNPLGLYDLVGDGMDWVNDWYDPKGYVSGPSHNPTGPDHGTEKVMRGSLPNEDFTHRPHLERWHEVPKDLLIGTEDPHPYPYVTESFRCVVNQTQPVAAGGGSK